MSPLAETTFYKALSESRGQYALPTVTSLPSTLFLSVRENADHIVSAEQIGEIEATEKIARRLNSADSWQRCSTMALLVSCYMVGGTLLLFSKLEIWSPVYLFSIGAIGTIIIGTPLLVALGAGTGSFYQYLWASAEFGRLQVTQEIEV